MKQLVCEMCGSTDLMKQEGVFVCQTCGTKYSVEDAKKMMMEVEGTVNVQNAAQLDNLMNLAHSSFDSKNYAKAEDFCNQVIAMNDQNYDAWKLKGEAINYQINAKNPRIDEVINCILTAYRVLDDEGKEQHREEIVSSVRECLEGEVDFWVKQIEALRPTASTVSKAKQSYLDSKLKLLTALIELGVSEEDRKIYNSKLDNRFINSCSLVVSSAWKTTVGYNYYRDDFDCLGSRWIVNNFHNIDFRTGEYRPSKGIWDTFLSETDYLIAILQFAETLFNDDTPAKTMETIFSNIAFFEERLIESYSFKKDFGCASTWDTQRNLGWCREYSLNETAKSNRRSIVSKYKEKERTVPAQVKKRQEAKKEAEKQERIKKYWEVHKDEKQQLDSEQADVKKQMKEINAQISEIDQKNQPRIDSLRKEREAKTPLEVEYDNQKSMINDLENQKRACNIFQGKKKKELQEQIDQATFRLEEMEKKAESERKEHDKRINSQIDDVKNECKDLRDKVTKLSKRNDEITAELTKDRK